MLQMQGLLLWKNMKEPSERSSLKQRREKSLNVLTYGAVFRLWSPF